MTATRKPIPEPTWGLDDLAGYFGVSREWVRRHAHRSGVIAREREARPVRLTRRDAVRVARSMGREFASVS